MRLKRSAQKVRTDIRRVIARVSLYSLAALLLGAHFLRGGSIAMLVLCSMTPLLFILRRRWVLYLLQVLAYCAAAGWINLALQMVEARQRLGQPWQLAAAILGAVALLTLLAGTLLNSHAMKQRYAE